MPEDAAALREAAAQVGITLSETKQALLVQGDEWIGADREAPQAGINVTAVAAISAGSGPYGMILWVVPADLDRAADVLVA